MDRYKIEYYVSVIILQILKFFFLFFIYLTMPKYLLSRVDIKTKGKLYSCG